MSFLISEGQLGAAVDIYHRALGTDAVASDNKVYLSLWVIGEAMAEGKPPDQLATAYLRGRQGDLWTDELARLATGRSRPRPGPGPGHDPRPQGRARLLHRDPRPRPGGQPARRRRPAGR